MEYKIHEIFYSLQGEGFLQGIPMVFIRFTGCNLKCSFCDTKTSWKKGIFMNIEEIINKIKKYQCKKVCLTGGEPLLQDISFLIRILKKEKYWICIETNGTIWRKLVVDWITVSPKKKGRKYHFKGYDKRFWKIANEFKYVITEEKDIEWIDRSIKIPVILQPVNNDIKITREIIKFLKTNPMKNWYLRLQLQKIIHIK